MEDIIGRWIVEKQLGIIVLVTGFKKSMGGVLHPER
jgi:hypothetical protein